MRTSRCTRPNKVKWRAGLRPYRRLPTRNTTLSPRALTSSSSPSRRCAQRRGAPESDRPGLDALDDGAAPPSLVLSLQRRPVVGDSPDESATRTALVVALAPDDPHQSPMAKDPPSRGAPRRRLDGSRSARERRSGDRRVVFGVHYRTEPRVPRGGKSA